MGRRALKAGRHCYALKAHKLLQKKEWVESRFHWSESKKSCLLFDATAWQGGALR